MGISAIYVYTAIHAYVYQYLGYSVVCMYSYLITFISTYTLQ